MTTLTLKKRQKLQAIVAELQARNIQIPEEVQQELLGIQKEVKWPFDKNGYTVKNDGTRFEANPKQQQFIDSDARFAGMFSARGGGKSASGSQKAVKKISKGESGAVLNPTFEDFKVSTWPEFRSWIPWNMVVGTQRYMGNPEWSPTRPFTLNFLNGAFVICKGLSNPDSARGPNINWLWYDEARNDLTGDAWKIAIASVRIGKEPQSWVTTTPRGKAHWLYKFFLKQDIPEEVFEIFKEADPNRPLIEYVITDIEDNKDHLDPGFYASLLAFYSESAWLKKQELDGEFVDQEGILGEAVAAMLRQKILMTPPKDVDKRVRYWDMGATEKKMIPGKRKNDPDETLGTKMSFKNLEDRYEFYIEHQEGDYKEWDDILDMIVDTAVLDGPTVQIVIEEEPGSGGKNQVAAVRNHLREKLPGWPDVIGWRPEGDRVLLANVWFAEAKLGNIYVISGEWNKKCIDQIEGFPMLQHDDKVTSITGARLNLAPIAKWKKIAFMKL